MKNLLALINMLFAMISNYAKEIIRLREKISVMDDVIEELIDDNYDLGDSLEEEVRVVHRIKFNHPCVLFRDKNTSFVYVLSDDEDAIMYYMLLNEEYSYTWRSPALCLDGSIPVGHCDANIKVIYVSHKRVIKIHDKKYADWALSNNWNYTPSEELELYMFDQEAYDKSYCEDVENMLFNSCGNKNCGLWRYPEACSECTVNKQEEIEDPNPWEIY